MVRPAPRRTVTEQAVLPPEADREPPVLVQWRAVRDRARWHLQVELRRALRPKCSLLELALVSWVLVSLALMQPVFQCQAAQVAVLPNPAELTGRWLGQLWQRLGFWRLWLVPKRLSVASRDPAHQ